MLRVHGDNEECMLFRLHISTRAKTLLNREASPTTSFNSQIVGDQPQAGERDAIKNWDMT
jgi:hypothetical protein